MLSIKVHGVNHRVNLWEKYKEKGVMFTGVYKSKKDNETSNYK